MLRDVLKLAWPLIISNSFWNLQMTIDRIFLGQYSTDALGAAIAVFGVFWAPMALVQQSAAYVTTFVAQYFGAKRNDRIGAALWQSFYVSAIGGALFLILIPISPTLFAWMGHSQKLQPLEIDYFNAMTWSALPTALVAAQGGFFSGIGKTSVIMVFNGIGLVVNVVFDYLMIFGKFGFPALGVAGAGYATALANWVAAIYGFYLVFQLRYESEFKTRSAWRWDPSLMRQFLKFGVPSGLQWALEGFAFTVFLVIVGRMANGDAALAASGIAVTIMMLAVLPAVGIAQAVSVLVGQFLGEDKPERAEAASWSGLKVAALYIWLASTTFWLFPSFYLSWFHNPDTAANWSEIVTITTYLLMFVSTFTVFDSVNMVFSFALKGAGDTRFVTLVALAMPWPMMVLPAFLTSQWEGAVYWAWGAASVYIICQAMVFLARFRAGKWKSMRVIQGV